MNPAHLTIQDVQRRYDSKLDEIRNVIEQAENPLALQLDTALGVIAKSTAFRLIHPLLIKRYSKPRMKYREHLINCIGLDVETIHTTGEPKLIGVYNADPYGHYRPIYNPKLDDLFDLVEGITSNGDGQHIAVWGTLDIQILLRLFDPTPDERLFISRGISSRVFEGEFAADPPVKRRIGKSWFYVAHYIPGRSMKLGILDEKGYESTIWVFNISQFFPGTIAQTAKALGLFWNDFDSETHLIDWTRYERDNSYNKAVRDSNRQDAIIVQQLSRVIQSQFHAVFGVYPSLLVSTGSLTDAAVGKLLELEDYKACSWDWLRHHVWENSTECNQAEVMLAEAFSAGYVDQFAMGYFEQVCTADIAAAYPHKIRALPDLRECEIVVGKDVEALQRILEKYDVETVIFRGTVTIPATLIFHPITVKTYNRENYRPLGTFKASYTLEERTYCEKYGATFTDEEWAVFIIHNRKPSPLSLVSSRLGNMRDELLAKREEFSVDSDNYKFLDGQQYVTKVIDNSIYGKTVMTTEYVENIDGVPLITGYIAGDRFNLLYGVLITSRTRIQIAEACTRIAANGGRPIMTMTDSIYWEGKESDLPVEYVAEIKTAGYFESPEIVEDFYLIKTGQYEYRIGEKWSYKLRGLNVPWESLDGNRHSFYRRLIQSANFDEFTHPKDITIPLDTRKLISIGLAHDLNRLGLVSDEITELKPFILSSKQATRYILEWDKCIDSHIWLSTPKIRDESGASQAPLFFLNELYTSTLEMVKTKRVIKRRKRDAGRALVLRDSKKLFVWRAQQMTHKAPPNGSISDLTWEQLESHYGVNRDTLYGA